MQDYFYNFLLKYYNPKMKYTYIPEKIVKPKKVNKYKNMKLRLP